MVTFSELLKEPAIHAYIMRLVGEDGIELIRKFPPGEEYSDEDLAEMTEIGLNSVRHTLYTLYERRLAEYRRLKNAETGWLTYLWHLNPQKVMDVIENEIKNVLDKIELRAVYEDKNDFYVCQHCGIRLTFDEAFGIDFECPNCDEPLTHFDNELLVVALKNRLKRIKETIRCVDV